MVAIKYYSGHTYSFDKIKLFYPNHIPNKLSNLKFMKKGILKYDFLFAGRFTPQKNVLKIAEIFKSISKTYNCIMIGEGELTNKIQKISNNKFEIRPFQDNIYDYYQNSKIFVNFSINEGLPNTVIENLILDKKVILSNIPEHRDLVGNNYPFLFELEENNLADKFIEVLQSPKKKDINTYFINNYISKNEEHHKKLINHLNSLNENSN